MQSDTRDTTLFSLATVKGYLSATPGTSHDQTLIRIADGVSARIDAYVRRPFVTREITELLPASEQRRPGRHIDAPLAGRFGTQCLQLRNFPVAGVTSAQYRYSLLDAWVSLDVNSEVELDAERGYLYLKQLAWSSIPLGNKIVYDAGFGVKDDPALPADVVLAALDFTKFCYDRWKANTISLGSLSVGAAGSAVIVPQLPKDVTDALERYVKRRL